MIGRLRSAFGRLAPRARWIALAAALLGGAALAFAPTHGVRQRTHRPPSRATRIRPTRGGRQRASPVSAAQVERARQVAREFLSGYLPFAYGRAPASLVPAAAPALRRQLRRERPLVAPVERRRHPHVVSLTALGQSAGVVVATALIDDGGVASYAVRFTLRQEREGWLVSAVDGG